MILIKCVHQSQWFMRIGYVWRSGRSTGGLLHLHRGAHLGFRRGYSYCTRGWWPCIRSHWYAIPIFHFLYVLHSHQSGSELDIMGKRVLATNSQTMADHIAGFIRNRCLPQDIGRMPDM